MASGINYAFLDERHIRCHNSLVSVKNTAWLNLFICPHEWSTQATSPVYFFLIPIFVNQVTNLSPVALSFKGLKTGISIFLQNLTNITVTRILVADNTTEICRYIQLNNEPIIRTTLIFTSSYDCCSSVVRHVTNNTGYNAIW